MTKKRFLTRFNYAPYSIMEIANIARDVESRLTELNDSTNGVLKGVGDNFVPGFKITRKVASTALNIADDYIDENEK